MNPVCPYCNQLTTFYKSSARFYHGKDFGPVYGCVPCEAIVGCHKGTTQPLGMPANPALRSLRRKAHAAFDPLWRSGKTVMKRKDAYQWLAREMGIEHHKCHIGMFDEQQCEKVVEVVQARLK